MVYNPMAPPMPAGLNSLGRSMDEQSGLRQGQLQVADLSERNFVPGGYFEYNPNNLMEMAQISSRFFQDMSSPRQYFRKVSNFMELYNEMQNGVRGSQATFRENLSYDDFQYIMQDVLYRKMLEKWSVPRSPYRSFSREIKLPTVNRAGKMFTLDGLEGIAPVLVPGEQPTVRYPQDSAIAVKVYKYGFDVEILWETLIEDDLNALGDIPDRLNNAYQGTIGRIFTGMYADSGGFRDGAPGDPFFVSNNDKILNPSLGTSDPAGVNNVLADWSDSSYGTPPNAQLTMPALQAARAQVSEFLSPVDRNPIDVSVTHLVVGSQLESVARNIVGAEDFVTERGGGLPGGVGTNDGLVRLRIGRNAVGTVNIHVDPYLHVVAASTQARTMWMLLADPGLARPLFCYAVLAGHESPLIARRIPQWRGVGSSGGTSTDWISTGFRLMFLIGAQWGDARGGIVSAGGNV